MSYHGGCLRFPTAYTVLTYLGCVSVDTDADSLRVVYVARGDSCVCVVMLLCLAFCVYLFSPSDINFEADILKTPRECAIVYSFLFHMHSFLVFNGRVSLLMRSDNHLAFHISRYLSGPDGYPRSNLSI